MLTLTYMEKVIQEILLHKQARDITYLTSLIAHEAQAGDPWFG
jgi:hypothetical protein